MWNANFGGQWQMVAGFVRKSVLGIFLATLVLGQAVAEESDARRGASELAQKNFTRALTVMSETIKSCENKAKAIEIPHWKKIGTSRESLLLGIVYFNLKRDNECMATAAKDLLMAAKMLEISDRYEWEKVPSTEFVDMILDAWWKELEAEVQYRSQVSPASREKIERISGLHQPFNMIQSWDASGN